MIKYVKTWLSSVVFGLFFVVLLSCLGTTVVSAGSSEKHWYDGFWPLGDRVPVKALKDEYIPFQSTPEIPERPPLFVELGDGFLDIGNLSGGFEVPIIGAVWQPRLWSYMINRTALQSFDNNVE